MQKESVSEAVFRQFERELPGIVPKNMTLDRPVKLIKFMQRNLRMIRRTYIKALEADGQTGADEWLCDNYHILEREGRKLVQKLRRSPALPTAKEHQLPLIFLLCEAMYHCCTFLPVQEDLEHFIDLMQQQRALYIVELEMLPVFLRCVFLEEAGLVATRSVEDNPSQRIGNAIKALRNIEDMDFSELIERKSIVEKILSQDPSGIYSDMHEDTRTDYRNQTAALAKSEHITEENAAMRVLNEAKSGDNELTRHVGYYLQDSGKRYRNRGRMLLCCESLLPLLLSLFLAFSVHMPLLFLLLYFPVWEILKPFLEYSFLRGVRPKELPHMELEGNIPEEAPVLVTVSTLLPGADKAGDLYGRLERLYTTNGRGAIMFCVLADLKEASTPHDPGDAATIDASRRVIAQLNAKYGDHFVLAVRHRTFSPTGNCYTGTDRKRGAIESLVRLICEGDPSFRCLEGNLLQLRQTKYILALDADTDLLMDAASQLLSAALHPLNRPQIDPQKKVVTGGFGIISPRVGVSLHSANATSFSRIMAGVGGVTTYDNAASERYQDLFGDSIFAGKGLIDVHAFYHVMLHTLPKERVLSHDILEGAFLRTGYFSTVEVSDSFPARAEGWFSRLHRWIRGDFQNILWLFRRIPTENGTQENPLSVIAKYKLFDNLRRALTPCLALACILLCLFLPDLTARMVCLVGLLSACTDSLFAALRSAMAGGPAMISRQYYSRTMPHALHSLIRGVVNMILLPQTALVGLDAALRALYRQFISRKKLLEWVPAADSDAGGITARGILSRYVLAFLAGGLLTVFAPIPLVRLAGIIFLCLPLFAYVSDKPLARRKVHLSNEKRTRLLSYAAAMWRYYEEFCGSTDHYLLPDNIQETPVHRIAHRTSPTNIGLMLLCFLAARDLGFIDSHMLFSRLEKSLHSIELLEKWHGNLLNWYDTKTLLPLIPRYVSTVDSGNLLCSLIALREGLREYLQEEPRLRELLQRIERLIEDTELLPLYNRRRALFHIGYDLEQKELSSSYYDLLMSEARMTSYYCIAKRIVPKKHWGMLGRTLARSGRYTGPVSWTGTMFEYFMPHLLLPVYEDSLNYEALKFCLYCQKRRSPGKDFPWGNSESGFYAFDPQLNYQYKAHGTQKLGLKRGLDTELVVSPYSSFLALPFDPEPVMHNLYRLERMHLRGRCGFYEAADFTKDRTGGHPFAPVRSYMAHHVGMSMLSVLNALKDNILHKRFMRDSQMAGATELLQEKIPAGAVVFEDVELREIPTKPGRISTGISEFTQITPVAPRVHLLSNGEWAGLFSDTGASLIIYRGADITRRSADLLRRPQGIFAVAESEGMVMSVTKAPDYSSGTHYKVEFSKNHVLYSAKKGFLEVTQKAAVHPVLACEQRHFTLKNKAQSTKKVNLLLYFEPCLTTYSEDSAHPAFSRLFIEPSFDPQTRIMTFYRRQRSGEQPLFLAAGITQDIPFTYENARDLVLQSPYGMSSLLQAVSHPLQAQGGVPDPCAAFHLELTLPAHSHKEVSLLLAAASTREEALDRLLSARRENPAAFPKGAPTLFASGQMEDIICKKILPQILFPQRGTPAMQEAMHKNERDTRALWELGISGDYPLLLLVLEDYNDVARIQPYLQVHKRLSICGIYSDLAVAFSEGGEYDLPILQKLKELLRQINSEVVLGKPGGVHAVDLTRHDWDALTLLKACACHISLPVMEEKGPPAGAYIPSAITPVAMLEELLPEGIATANGLFADDAFILTSFPNAPFSHILANPTFGTLISHQALGYTWAVNSRENKLTPWYNDCRFDNRGELLLVRIGDRVYDLLLGARMVLQTQQVEWRGSFGGLTSKVTVSVPRKGMIKYVDVRLYNETGEAISLDSAYYTEPVLENASDIHSQIKAKWQRGALCLYNPSNLSVSGYMVLTAQGGAEGYCCDRTAFLQGRWNEPALLPMGHGCAAITLHRKLAARESCHLRFMMSFAANLQAAVILTQLELPQESLITTPLRVKTPDPALDLMVNTFLPLQILNSRVLGRTGFYQCGGAYGFRDQLQDVCALIQIAPQFTKRQIFRAAGAQFPEGDVLHWWHQLPAKGGGIKGVRTRYSDDLLWLAYVTAEYVEKTGDHHILRQRIPYLSGEVLAPHESERYFQPGKSELSETVYEHCLRAIQHGLRKGEHGIPLIGEGDWNDGFNRIGKEGRGESVWLAQFLAIVLEKMAPLCEVMQDSQMADTLRREASLLKRAVDEQAWDGEWYLRAFFDDGSPVGGHQSEECRIDLLSQAFSVLSDMPDHARREQALNAALLHLVDREVGIIKLFTPAFSGQLRNPGYVCAYPNGIRENGGQYTHGAIWLIMALLREQRPEEAYALLSMLNPIRRTMDPQRAARYRLDPYAIAADISAHPQCNGRGGWSLYTGAAGWYYRTVVEEMLGLRLKNGEMTYAPCLPPTFEESEIHVEYAGKKVEPAREPLPV